MKKLRLFALIAFAISAGSCMTTEQSMQANGFRPYPKTRASGYEQATRNFVGYGTYQRPNRKGVDR